MIPTKREFEAAAQLRIALRRFLSRSEQISRAHGLTSERYQLLLLIKVSAAGDFALAAIDGLVHQAHDVVVDFLVENDGHLVGFRDAQ